MNAYGDRLTSLTPSTTLPFRREYLSMVVLFSFSGTDIKTFHFRFASFIERLFRSIDVLPPSFQVLAARPPAHRIYLRHARLRRRLHLVHE